MNEEQPTKPSPPAPDLNESPFTPGPIEGIPYKRGSEEDLAIPRILEKARLRERAQ
jgi:hypothetical protein